MRKLSGIDTESGECCRVIRESVSVRVKSGGTAGNGNAVYRLDIRLQGDNETVFFEV